MAKHDEPMSAAADADCIGWLRFMRSEYAANVAHYQKELRRAPQNQVWQKGLRRNAERLAIVERIAERCGWELN